MIVERMKIFSFPNLHKAVETKFKCFRLRRICCYFHLLLFTMYSILLVLFLFHPELGVNYFSHTSLIFWGSGHNYHFLIPTSKACFSIFVKVKIILSPAVVGLTIFTIFLPPKDGGIPLSVFP